MMPDPAHQPFVVEGEGDSVLKIHFETEEAKQAYMVLKVEHPGDDFKVNLNNPV